MSLETNLPGKTPSVPTLRPLETRDIQRVNEWPAYSPDFHELDYALRENGWLTEFSQKPLTRCYIAQEAGEPIGFTILSKTGVDEAEFRIALRGDKIRHGYGRAITVATLEKGFSEMRLKRIHLIVRKNNEPAMRLYQDLGFSNTGECLRDIQGKPVAFFEMDIDVQTWLRVRQGR